MSCLYSCAVAWDFIDTNPVKQFSKRHIKELPPRTTYPTAEQVDRLVANIAPMTGRIIRLRNYLSEAFEARAGSVCAPLAFSRYILLHHSALSWSSWGTTAKLGVLVRAGYFRSCSQIRPGVGRGVDFEVVGSRGRRSLRGHHGDQQA
jgi:hypothetical protein